MLVVFWGYYLVFIFLLLQHDSIFFTMETVVLKQSIIKHPLSLKLYLLEAFKPELTVVFSSLGFLICQEDGSVAIITHKQAKTCTKWEVTDESTVY